MNLVNVGKKCKVYMSSIDFIKNKLRSQLIDVRFDTSLKLKSTSYFSDKILSENQFLNSLFLAS